MIVSPRLGFVSRTIVLLGVLLGSTALASNPGTQSEEPHSLAHRPVDPIQALEQYLVEKVMPDIPGAALAVIVDGNIELLQGYGVRREGQAQRVDADTLFRLASVSKTIAATAAGLAVHHRELEWQTPVSRTLSLEFKNPDYGRQITLQSILSHTTGLMPQAYTNLIEANVPYQKAVKRLREVDFICPPKSCYSYQNLAFSLVGDLLLAATGETYEAYVQRQLFEPLDMKTASFGWQNFTDSENRATPHIKIRGRWRPVSPKRNYYNVAPAAGANASIRDMALWVLAQLGQKPNALPLEVLDTLHRPQVATSYRQAHYRAHPQLRNIHYGLGWRLFEFAGYRGFVHHGGWVQGFRTEVLFNRELQMGLVFLSNSENRYARELVYRFLEGYTDYHRVTHQPQTLVQDRDPAHDSGS